MKSRCLDTRLRLLTQMMVLCPAVVAECPEMSDHLVTEVKCHFRISQRRHLCYATVRLFETFCDHSRTDQHHLDHKNRASCQGIKNCRHKFIWKNVYPVCAHFGRWVDCTLPSHGGAMYCILYFVHYVLYDKLPWEAEPASFFYQQGIKKKFFLRNDF